MLASRLYHLFYSLFFVNCNQLWTYLQNNPRLPFSYKMQSFPTSGKKSNFSFQSFVTSRPIRASSSLIWDTGIDRSEPNGFQFQFSIWNLVCVFNMFEIISSIASRTNVSMIHTGDVFLDFCFDTSYIFFILMHS